MVAPKILLIIIVVVVLVVMVVILLFRRHRKRQHAVIQGEASVKKRICPKCGLENDRDAKFCSDCGFKFLQQ
jgi:ribosomal protein L40E